MGTKTDKGKGGLNYEIFADILYGRSLKHREYYSSSSVLRFTRVHFARPWRGLTHETQILQIIWRRRRRRARVQIAVATLSGNSLRQTVHTHCASVYQAAKLVAASLSVVGVTAGLAECGGSLPPGL